MSDGGNSAQIGHITFKGFQSPSLAFGKVDRLPQGPTTLLAVLKMIMQDDKVRSSSGTFAFFVLSDHLVVGGPSTMFDLQMLSAHQTQRMIQISGSSPWPISAFL